MPEKKACEGNQSVGTPFSSFLTLPVRPSLRGTNRRSRWYTTSHKQGYRHMASTRRWTDYTADACWTNTVASLPSMDLCIYQLDLQTNLIDVYLAVIASRSSWTSGQVVSRLNGRSAISEFIRYSLQTICKTMDLQVTWLNVVKTNVGSKCRQTRLRSGLGEGQGPDFRVRTHVQLYLVRIRPCFETVNMERDTPYWSGYYESMKSGGNILIDFYLQDMSLLNQSAIMGET